MSIEHAVNVLYLIASILFIYDLKLLARPRTAVTGNYLGILGMALAIVATLIGGRHDWGLLVLGVAIGSVIGVVIALRVKMTAMPEMVGLLNGFGGLASVLVAGSAMMAAFVAYSGGPTPAGGDLQMKVATVASGIIGSVTFFGSYVAFGKLAEFLCVKWKLKPWQKLVKYGYSTAVVAGALWYGIAHWDPQSTVEDAYALVFIASGIAIGGLLLLKKDRFPGMGALKVVTAVAAVAFGVLMVLEPSNILLYWALVGVSGVLGVLLTMSIGGADMPVVIALLNSYSGLAATATGFVINNNVLIISGALVGASGVILTNIMCKAMNRSLANVLFGTVGPTGDTPDADAVYRTVKAASAEEVAMVLDSAQRVVIVPGYGMAVAQAQHAVRDLANQLESRGTTVEYAIHPVAGRMPGHMNVLLAEADVPYDKLFEMDSINPTMAQVDVAIVVGANDVVNPVARTDPGSPIAGMPIIDVDKARTVVVIKRSLSPGFAGIPNPLFALDNTLMFFNDGKKAILELLAAVKDL
ncbi:MAG TPA: NAD(P)(+) transhydrogenase (Re/Si-specific) subunit beta [Thermoanaerobaculales bacterium]|mgnify:CR=1 FL=1|nr:NAD(P)(+) transhydrogenase (Re/Si-specific) subunit beta [Thermoanaerobaculales bacterium]HPA81011.1 NAD(P)(+) transhydrogenase (Re/Si-specific) subunit beta [Thermoanaerobaculales bacterium]HQL31064.1 NAD(P)(+) transhydrogenase (Re/Si-specific) subunit beta [Thermoanaerobaculales bacterium]HQN96582.1 NAD(P)(+) transhydrogenase (Re/Si-specific) subunit beta [Thermoanaerobaculales bacterium]HQP44140.1 NAD(P)(+) transhydrogenase (Re/Si-specific) subunit beta [Thermoanaerobaculales bacterium]